jgi:predicted Zn-dependent peptidase
VLRQFYSERDVVMEERRMRYESRPRGKLFETFLALAFQAHPYRNPTIGWPSDIAFFDRLSTERFYRSYYVPNNTVVAIVGDIDPPNLTPMLVRYYAPIPAGDLPGRHSTREPKQTGERRAIVRFKAEPRLAMGFHKPTAPHRDDYVLDLVDLIFSAGRTSRMYRQLVEQRQLAVSVNTSNGLPGIRYDNLFTVFATPRHPHTADEVEAAVLEELERLKREEVGGRDIQKVKNQLEAQFLRGLRSNSGLASQLTYYQAGLGDWRYITRYLKVIESISAVDIQRVAEKYFTAENRTLVTLLSPQEPASAPETAKEKP